MPPLLHITGTGADAIGERDTYATAHHSDKDRDMCTDGGRHTDKVRNTDTDRETEPPTKTERQRHTDNSEPRTDITKATLAIWLFASPTVSLPLRCQQSTQFPPVYVPTTRAARPK